MLPEKIRLLEVSIGDGEHAGPELFAGRHHTRAYPTTEELHDFGRRICGVSQPGRVFEAIAAAMRETLAEAKADDRVPASLLAKMHGAWEMGMTYAR